MMRRPTPSVNSSIYPDMNKPWKIILLLAGIFIAGGVTGAFVMKRVGRELLARRAAPEQWAPQQVKRLMDRLDLTPDQMEAVRPILRRNMEQLNRLRSYSLAETRSIMEQMQREIAGKLTPEQRAKFEQINKEMRERVKRFMNDRPSGGPRNERPRPPGEPGRPEGEVPPPEKPPGH
jgi:Spy/CpxP family protein refolding chaperone